MFQINITKIFLLLLKHGPDKLHITTELDPAMPAVDDTPATFKMEIAKGYGEEWLKNNLPDMEYEVLNSSTGDHWIVNEKEKIPSYKKGDGIRAFLQGVDPSRCEIGDYFVQYNGKPRPSDPLAWAAFLRGMEVKEEYTKSWTQAQNAIAKFSGIPNLVLDCFVDEFETEIGRPAKERIAAAIDEAEKVEKELLHD